MVAEKASGFKTGSETWRRGPPFNWARCFYVSVLVSATPNTSAKAWRGTQMCFPRHAVNASLQARAQHPCCSRGLGKTDLCHAALSDRRRNIYIAFTPGAIQTRREGALCAPLSASTVPRTRCSCNAGVISYVSASVVGASPASCGRAWCRRSSRVKMRRWHINSPRRR